MGGQIMEHDSMMMLLTGPASALALAVTMLIGIGRMVSKYIPQLVDKHIRQIDEQIEASRKISERLDLMHERMNEQHVQNSETIRSVISGVHKRLNPIENDIKEMKTFMKLDNQFRETHNTNQ